MRAGFLANGRTGAIAACILVMLLPFVSTGWILAKGGTEHSDDARDVLGIAENGIRLFRGHRNSKYELRSKYYRKLAGIHTDRSSQKSIKTMLQQWRSSAISVGVRPPEDDVECLAIAQHHGLATPLLDWSTNPLIALFFAVENDTESDGVDGKVFSVVSTYVGNGVKRDLDKMTDLDRVNPPICDPRIAAQQACFTFDAGGNIDQRISTRVSLRECIIDNGSKRELQKRLDVFGINRRTAFPDADGLSEYVNWSAAQFPKTD